MRQPLEHPIPDVGIVLTQPFVQPVTLPTLIVAPGQVVAQVPGFTQEVGVLHLTAEQVAAININLLQRAQQFGPQLVDVSITQAQALGISPGRYTYP